MPGAESRAAFLRGGLAEGQRVGTTRAGSLCQWRQADAWLSCEKLWAGPAASATWSWLQRQNLRPSPDLALFAATPRHPHPPLLSWR